jgi:dipeptidyl aminopeptidase/acylaminoacyl peptidase
MKSNTLCAFVLATIFALAAVAQVKPTLKPADYGKWESLGAATLSPDGKWISHEIRRTDGNNELRITAASGGKPTIIAFCSGAAYSFDSHWLACESTVSEAEADRLKKASRPVAQNKLQVLELANGTITAIDGVQSFAFSGDGDYVAFRRYAPTAAAGAANATGGGGRGGRGGGRGGDAAGGDADRPDPTGSTLTVRNLATGVDTTFGNVTSYSFQDNGTNLAMTIGVEGRTGNAIQVFDPKSGSLKVLDNGSAVFTALVWRKESSDLAALRSVKQDGFDGESYSVLAWKSLGEKKSAKVNAPQRIVSSRPPQWSEDGETIYVGIADWPKKASGKADDDPSTVEVWHWKDENVISEQKLTAARDRDRNVSAAWHVAGGELVQLSKNNHEDVRLPKRGNRALALDGTPYVTDSMFGRRFDDVYKVDMKTGARSQIAKHLIPPVDFSPGGKFALNFKEGQFWVYDLDTGASKNISKDAASTTGFANKENDYPVSQKPAYGIAGWTKDDRSVLVYDAYDIWELFPDGAKPRKLTDGAADEVRHRYVRTSGRGGGRGGRGGGGGEDAEGIDLAKPVYLSLEGRWTKKTGYARLVVSNETGKVEREILIDKGVRGLEKAKNADVYAYQAGAWNESPNLYVAGADLRNAAKVSDTNPFASQYAWGKAELVDYKNSHGDRLQGALYYPANYEAGKKYPMIVQIYEIESNQLHNWGAPSERNTYNATVWTQNGYFVLRPDITFKPRNPGLSALDCVTSAVKTVLAKGGVDAKKIGLIGHSWGGYETTFILTQTDMFAAGAAGGPLTNLASSYGEIYWNNGGPETNHAEVGQERMEVPLYEDPQSYIRNSAVYFANKLAAPLLLSVGDKDGASDWHQDIELYNSARRAGKNVVMLVYEGENHSVAQKGNQLDYHRRINAWFDHYVKGDPAEPWINEGVSVLKREQELKKSPGGEKATPTGLQ